MCSSRFQDIHQIIIIGPVRTLTIHRDKFYEVFWLSLTSLSAKSYDPVESEIKTFERHS